MIGIIDYGVGNIKAFANVYERLNIPVSIATNADSVKTATKIILPGVGAFDHAMRKFNHSGMRDIVDELVLDQQVPILGICVGFQMFAHSSEEGKLPGLAWTDGIVRKFDLRTLDTKTRYRTWAGIGLILIVMLINCSQTLAVILDSIFCILIIFNAIMKKIRLQPPIMAFNSPAY